MGWTENTAVLAASPIKYFRSNAQFWSDIWHIFRSAADLHNYNIFPFTDKSISSHIHQLFLGKWVRSVCVYAEGGRGEKYSKSNHWIFLNTVTCLGWCAMCISKSCALSQWRWYSYHSTLFIQPKIWMAIEKIGKKSVKYLLILWYWWTNVIFPSNSYIVQIQYFVCASIKCDTCTREMKRRDNIQLTFCSHCAVVQSHQ